METSFFVEKINSIKIFVSKEDSKKYSESFLSEYLKGHKIILNGHKSDKSNCILKLLDENDISNISIGALTFDNSITENENYLIFGSFDADLIAINKETEEIELLEYGLNNTLCFCSNNSQSFLNAVLLAAEYIYSSSPSIDLSEYQEEVCIVCHNCTEIAGGKRYNVFYKMLLGCYE